jgi:hypothetical protein
MVPVNRLPAPFDILTRPISPIFIVFHRPTAALEKRRLHFGKWKCVKAITFGAYLAKIECDTARLLESVSMVDSINSASSSSSTYPAHFSKLVISEFLLPFPSLKLYSSVLNHLDDYDQN